MIVYIIAGLALIGGLYFLYINTVEGWEDEDGFHPGRNPNQDL